MIAGQPLLEMDRITKRFGASVLANDAVSFDLRAGEIHALLGENGAGKSTLMNILYGLYAPSEGRMRLRGEPLELASPSDAIAKGIGMIHQEFMLIEPFTVAENLAMGTAPLPQGARGADAARERITELSRAWGLEVDPDARIEHLSVGQRQRVEILKLLFRSAELLVLDEPTAVLTPPEADGLFEVLDRLRRAGKSIVIVTHKMHEVMAISDRVSTMRDGRMVATVETTATDERSLVRLMVGRELSVGPGRATASHGHGDGRVVLEAARLEVAPRHGGQRAPAADLAVRSGEILGIAGVDGNGQTELIETLFGLREALGGHVMLDGLDVTGLDCAARRDRGLGYVPPDRRTTGALVTRSIEDNVILGASRHFSTGGFIDRDRSHRAAAEVIHRFGVRAPGPSFVAGKLSGGNLQKLVLGREISRAPRALLVEQPTRGLDVGAIELVWQELATQRDAGTAVLLASTELDEIMALSDRIAVMFEGRIMEIVARADASAERLGLLMAGRRPHDSQGFDGLSPVGAAA